MTPLPLQFSGSCWYHVRSNSCDVRTDETWSLDGATNHHRPKPKQRPHKNNGYTMFLPGNAGAKADEDIARKKGYKNIEEWSLEEMPAEIRGDALVSVQEFVCGDPECAPIDTAVTISFKSGGNGMFGIPLEAKKVTKEDLTGLFPTAEVLQKWHKGEDAEWPPMDEGDPMSMPELRFDMGTRVLCRIGPNADTDWAPGTISQLWYKEPNWPPNSFAPYQIKLDDGRSIFAPADLDQVIRKQP